MKKRLLPVLSVLALTACLETENKPHVQNSTTDRDWTIRECGLGVEKATGIDVEASSDFKEKLKAGISYKDAYEAALNKLLISSGASDAVKIKLIDNYYTCIGEAKKNLIKRQ